MGEETAQWEESAMVDKLSSNLRAYVYENNESKDSKSERKKSKLKELVKHVNLNN